MKKIISLITVIMLAVTMLSVTAYAFPTADKDAVNESNNFTPAKFDVDKKSGTITIDGEKDVESAYGNKTIKVQGLTDYNTMTSEGGGATGTAHVAWDADYIYIHLMVEDTTKYIGEDFNYDGVEVYLDYDQTGDGQKVKWNKLQSSHVFAAQYRIQRETKEKAAIPTLSNNENMSYVGEKSKIAVEEVTGGYVVEAAFPLKNKSGKYLPISNNIGFELQINDNQNGTGRTSGAYIQGGLQAYAYEYTHLMDTLVLDKANDITWNTRKPTTVVADPSAKPSSTASAKPSSAASSKPSSAATSPSSAPSAAASEDTVSSAIENTISSDVASKEDANTDTPNEDATTDDDTTTIGASTDENKGGLPVGAIIGIIAGAVVLLGGAGAVVFIILKKKKQA